MNYREELSARILDQHCLGCKVAIAVNLIWAISVYFIFPENKWVYSTINLAVVGIIVLVMLNRKRIKIAAEAVGLIPTIPTITAFAFIYNTIDLDVFQQMSFMYLGVFIGAGMFLLWNIRYSLFTVVYTIAINGLFFLLFSPISFDEYMINGGALIIIVSGFMIITIQARYNLVKNNVRNQLILRENEQEIKKSEEQHRLLFEKNPAPMMIYSLETLKILAVNDLIISKYGFTRSEFLEMSIKDLHNEIEQNEVEICAEESLEGNDNVSEWIHVLKNKSEINVQLIAKSIEFNGNQARLVSINDITEVKHYQNDLIEAKQIAEISQERQSQFLSNMSHEIRTPMNGILGISKMLSKTDLDENQQNYLKTIVKSSENLMVIINDILDFSKIDAGKLDIEDIRFNLHETINVAENVLISKAKEKGLCLNFEIDNDVPQWIKGDSVRINQILLNLISNAIKFTESGGVTVKVSVLFEGLQSVQLQFDVADTGIGIANDKKENIFQSFTQANSSTTRTHGGTGLGLTITKQLIELQKGTIWVESELGKGSTFSFELTFTVEENGEEAERHSEKLDQKVNNVILHNLKGIKILLVEDHPINQMLARNVLEEWGFNVDLAENGSICLDMVAEKDYDLILMDLNMPVMDGLTASKEIRSGKYTTNSDVPIIAMTASAYSEDSDKCIEAGMNDYISKPFEPQDLLEKTYNNVINNLLQA